MARILECSTNRVTLALWSGNRVQVVAGSNPVAPTIYGYEPGRSPAILCLVCFRTSIRVRRFPREVLTVPWRDYVRGSCELAGATVQDGVRKAVWGGMLAY